MEHSAELPQCDWLLVYVDVSSLTRSGSETPTLFVRSGYHKSRSDPQNHFTLRAVRRDNSMNMLGTLHLCYGAHSIMFKTS